MRGRKQVYLLSLRHQTSIVSRLVPCRSTLPMEGDWRFRGQKLFQGLDRSKYFQRNSLRMQLNCPDTQTKQKR